ncbi:hypothetical protein [Conyzicola nivalis]|nr:hypothetical protein [Conyzicola nivalis]
MAYEFEPSHPALVTALLDRLAASEEDLVKVWQRLWLDPGYQTLDDALRAEVDFLFAYELQEEYGSAGVVTLEESQHLLTATRPMSETPPAAWALWIEVNGSLQNPIVAAHLADVLLTSRTDSSPDHAVATVNSYLSVAADGHVSSEHVALSLGRANSIARSRAMAEELAVRDTMIRLSGTFAVDPDKVGPALTLLAALSVPPRGGAFSEGERGDLERRLFALGNSYFTLVDEVFDTLARLAVDASALEIAQRWQVNQYLGLAEAEDNGMRKMHHAQSAADLAGSYGLRDLKGTAIVMMQSIDHDSMGWQSAVIDAPLSKNAFRAHLRRYRRARNWEYALMVFLASGSPSGDHEANVRSAERAAVGSIRALVSRTTYGTHGLPERSDGNFLDEEVVRNESFRLNFSGILLAHELEYVRDRFEPPSTRHVADWMAASFSSDPTLAEHFAESLALHWAGKFSDSARLAIPLIEAGARGLLLRLDEPLYRTQRGNSPGKFPTMDFYLEALSNRGLDPDWGRALRLALLSPGMNLRNRFAHGFDLSFTEAQSALLLRLAGLFCSMPVGMDESDLPAPTKSARGQLRRRPAWAWL